MNLSQTRVLVTGGAGFIGTTLARRYAGQVAEWVAYDNLLPQVHGENPTLDLPDGVRLAVGDVRDADTLAALVREVRPDVLVHLAAETGTGQSLDLPSMHTDVNVTGTARVFEACTAAGHLPGRIVLTSSRAIYGEGVWADAAGALSHPRGRGAAMLDQGIWDYPGLTPLPSSVATTPAAPCNIYGATKYAQEQLLSAWAAAREVSTAVLRLQNVYGPGQSPINPYTGITTLFFRLARRGEAIPVYEDGAIGRDFVFIDDVARAIWAALGREDDVLVDVGSGTRSTILDAAEIVAKFSDAPPPRITGQYRLGDVRSAFCAMAGSAWVYGDLAPVGLAEGLERLGGWMAERGIDL